MIAAREYVVAVRVLAACWTEVEGAGEELLPSDRQILGSYSRFIEGKMTHPSKKVYVPGYPPLLAESELYKAFSLMRDARQPEKEESLEHDEPQFQTKMEVVFRAIELCSPRFDLEGVDIVTDRFNLHELLRFCGTPSDM